MTATPATREVSAVVVSFNTKGELLACLRSLEAQWDRLLEIIVIDNASEDGSAQAVRAAFPAARVLQNPTNEGFARASNRGLREARGRYALILNSDAELGEGALGALVRHLEAHPEVAAAGPRTRSPDGAAQVSFGPRLTPRSEWRQRRLVKGVKQGAAWARREAERLASAEREPDWISGSCLLARRDALQAVGYFDEGFFLYEEDADLCLRLRQAGWRIAFTPEAEVIHRLGSSMAKAPALSRIEYQRSHLRYYRKHNGPLLTGALRGLLALLALLRLAQAAAFGSVEERRIQRAILGLALGIV